MKINHKTALYWFAALICSVLVACSNEEIIDLNSSPVSVRFSTSEDAAGIMDTNSKGEGWLGGDLVGIYMLQWGSIISDIYILEGAKNKRYKATNDKFIPIDGDIYYPVGGIKVDFKSYFPYTPNVSDNAIIEIDASNQANQRKFDYMYSNNAKKLDKNSKGRVKLKFKRVMSKLSFDIVEGNEGTDVEGATVSISLLKYLSKLNLSSGLNKLEQMSKNINGNRSDNSFVIPPQKIDAKKVLSVTLKNGAVVKGFMPEMDLMPGVNYNFTVRVNKDKLDVKIKEIFDWDGIDSPFIEGGTTW